MIDLSHVRRYYVACGYTDLRRGIDGLAAIVTQQYGSRLDEESLFLFCGRRTDRIKALYWSGDGYLLLYKRLSNGSFHWPRSEAELRLLDPQSFPPGNLLLLLAQQFTLPLAHGRAGHGGYFSAVRQGTPAFASKYRLSALAVGSFWNHVPPAALRQILDGLCQVWSLFSGEDPEQLLTSWKAWLDQ